MEHNKRGASLTELLISMSMASLALILLTALISRGNAWYRSTKAKSEAHHEILKALDKIRADLYQSAASSLTLHYPSGDPSAGDLALSFLTPHDRNGTFQKTPYKSEPVYVDHKLYYTDSNQRTLQSARSPYIPTPPDTNLTPRPMDLATLSGVAASPGRVVLRNLKEFTALDPVTGQPTLEGQNVVHLRLVVAVPVEGSNNTHESEAEILVRLPL